MSGVYSKVVSILRVYAMACIFWTQLMTIEHKQEIQDVDK